MASADQRRYPTQSMFRQRPLLDVRARPLFNGVIVPARLASFVFILSCSGGAYNLRPSLASFLGTAQVEEGMKKAILGLVLTMMATVACGQLRGYIEDFENGSMVSSWWGYADSTYYYPVWGGTADKYIYQSFTSFGYLYALSDSSSGNFVGDYVAQRIASVKSQLYWPIETQTPYIYISSSLGGDYLAAYSASLPADQWYTFNASVSNQWWDWNAGVWTVPDTNDLANIDLAGVYAKPVTTFRATPFVAIDNFTLYPEVVSPCITAMRKGGSPGSVDLEFQALHGQMYALDKRAQLTIGDWGAVPGHDNITGSGTVTVTVSQAESEAFYRLGSDVHLTTSQGMAPARPGKMPTVRQLRPDEVNPADLPRFPPPRRLLQSALRQSSQSGLPAASPKIKPSEHKGHTISASRDRDLSHHTHLPVGSGVLPRFLKKLHLSPH